MIDVIPLRKDVRATTDIDSHEQEIHLGVGLQYSATYTTLHMQFSTEQVDMNQKKVKKLLIEC